MTTSRSDEEIRVAVRRFWSNWTRKPNDDDQASWSKSLRPYWERPALMQAMRESIERDVDFMPSVAQLLARMRTVEQSGPKQEQQDKPLTDRERRRSEQSAVLSMLWLHYELGWSLERVGSHMLAAIFPGADLHQAIAAAKEQYPRETIRRWMNDQAANTPAPCDRTLGKHLAG